MEAAKHTPGPWSYREPDLGRFIVTTKTGKASSDVAALVTDTKINIMSQGRTRAEREANARLIAAAPELLDALKWVFGELEASQHSLTVKDQYARGRAAIARIEGKAARA